MKLVDRSELMKMPNGTVYFEYNGGTDCAPLVKHETIVHNGENIDWFYCMITMDEEYGLAMSKMEHGLEVEESVHILRDGCFDYEQKYAIMSKDLLVWLAMYDGKETADEPVRDPYSQEVEYE